MRIIIIKGQSSDTWPIWVVTRKRTKYVAVLLCQGMTMIESPPMRTVEDARKWADNHLRPKRRRRGKTAWERILKDKDHLKNDGTPSELRAVADFYTRLEHG